jgi:Flp pilus assembly protein TadG
MKFLYSDKADSLIELALLLPMLLLIVFYMADGAIWVQKSLTVQSAASAAAAYGAVPGNASNYSAMVQLANFDATGSTSGATGFTATATDFYTCSPGGAVVTATTSCPTGAPFHYVKVTTSLIANSVISMPGIPSTLTMPAFAIYRVEVTP